MITQETKSDGRTRSAVLVALALGMILAALIALAGTAREAEAAFPNSIVFTSDRTKGAGVENPTGDYEIFRMNPDGTGIRQLTFNAVDDSEPTLSPDGKKVAYTSGNTQVSLASRNIQTSSPGGDNEIYVMNALDGSGKKNLSNNSAQDFSAVFSPDGKKIVYTSFGIQTSNPEGDTEIYRVNVLDGSGKKNLTDNGADVDDFSPVFSPDGKRIAYVTYGIQTSNPEGENEVYLMNALDGLSKKNLSDNGSDILEFSPAFSPDGKKIAYQGYGIQTSNPEGDSEVYVMNALDGTGKKNLTDNGVDVRDGLPVFSPGGQKIAYMSEGIQTSNPEGDNEIYRVNVLDGSGNKNLTNNGVGDGAPDFSPDGKKIAYLSYGKQPSNPQGDLEVYHMNTLDGLGKKNLTDNGLDIHDDSPEWGVQAM